MYSLTKIPFDSQIFNCNVYKLYIEKEIIKENEFKKLLASKHIDILFCYSKFFTKNIRVLQKFGFSFISIRSTYKMNLKQYTFPKELKKLPSYVKVIQFSRNRFRILTEDSTNFVETLLPQSRYSKDPLVPVKIGRQIFTSWLQNSLYHQFADDSFMAMRGKRLIGMISFKIKGRVGFLDLVCILPQFQNLGIGKSLLYKVINHLREKNITTLIANTQGENIPANIFYQKNQFIIQDIEMVYHKHFHTL